MGTPEGKTPLQVEDIAIRILFSDSTHKNLPGPLKIKSKFNSCKSAPQFKNPIFSYLTYKGMGTPEGKTPLQVEDKSMYILFSDSTHKNLPDAL